MDILEEISSKGAPMVNDKHEETIDCSNTQKGNLITSLNLKKKIFSAKLYVKN